MYACHYKILLIIFTMYLWTETWLFFTIVMITPFIQGSSWHLQIAGQCLLVSILISHLIYEVCRTAFLIVTFLFSRILRFILPPSFISLRQTGIERSRPFSSFPTASFRHPLVPFLRIRLKTRRPSIERGFRWGCIRRFVHRQLASL